MMGRYLGIKSVLAGLCAVALATSSALADVTLVSQEARSGSGDWAVWPINPTDPTYNWDHPTVFNTTSSFTTLDPSGDGLQVNMTRSGSLSLTRGVPAGTGHYGSWTIQDFKVVFRVDEPTPFAVASSGVWGPRTSRYTILVPFCGTSLGTSFSTGSRLVNPIRRRPERYSPERTPSAGGSGATSLGKPCNFHCESSDRSRLN